MPYAEPPCQHADTPELQTLLPCVFWDKLMIFMDLMYNDFTPHLSQPECDFFWPCDCLFLFSLLWLFPPAAVISEHDTSASEDYNDANTAVVFIAHDLSAVEEEHSTDVQSDQDKDKETAAFLSDMYVLRDYYEISKRISFKYGEIVEVLDTARDDKWLVRKKSDSLQVFSTLLLIRYVHVCNNYFKFIRKYQC